MEKSQLQRKNEVLKSLKVIRLSNQGKIVMSLMIRTYEYSNKPQTIITELIAILLIINKLKFNFAFKNYMILLKRKQKKTTILFMSINL